MSTTTDGGKIASYMRETSSKFKLEGIKAVYAIIGTSWAISFIGGKFTPTCYVRWSLGLAITYVFLNLLYYLLSASYYKFLLFKYFSPVEDGDFDYRQNINKDDVTKMTTRWNHLGQIWSFVLALLLLTSFIFMLFEISSLY